MNKVELLHSLRAEHLQWEAALSAMGEARQVHPGAAGTWSVKDLIAHVTAYEHWLVQWLEAALRHEFPGPSLLDEPGVERRNALVYAATRDLPLAAVLADSRQVFEALLAVLEAFPEEDLVDAERAAWFVKPFWTSFDTVAECVLNYTRDHYHEHLPGLQALAIGAV